MIVKTLRRQLDRWAAWPMFFAATAFLLLSGVFFHIREDAAPPWLMEGCGLGMLLLWPLFIAELLLHLVVGSRRRLGQLLYCAAPPLRMAVRDHRTGRRVWFPWGGWTPINRELRRRLRRRFTGPIILAALLVLPILAIEYFAARQAQQNVVLGNLLSCAAGLIWLAFCVEFIVMVTVADDKLRYCREHWIDLAIILLPMAAFAPLLRLGWWFRLHQLSRAARLYQLRSALLRVFRTVLLVDLVGLLWPQSPQKRLQSLQRELEDHEAEAASLRVEIHRLENELAAEDNEQSAACGEELSPASRREPAL